MGEIDDLTGGVLDRAVAEALGFVFAETPATPGLDPDGEGICREGSTRWCRAPGEKKWSCARCYSLPDKYSEDWQHGGPLIERFGISIEPPSSPVHRNGGPNSGWGEAGLWTASTYRPRKGDGHRPFAYGDTPLQAAMRCVVDLHSAGPPRWPTWPTPAPANSGCTTP